jgi:prepilin-type N-terminal cleavage/methylation domain-containing protein
VVEVRPAATDGSEAPTWMRLRPRAGFTLIEVMGALMILSVAMLSVLRLSATSTERLRLVDRKAEAARIAVERSDSLGTVAYASLGVASQQFLISRTGDNWRVTQTVTQWSPRVRKVQVTVQLVADTMYASTVVAYRTDTW